TADTKVQMAGYNRKEVMQRTVSEVINKSEELITKAIQQDAPIYYAEAVGNSANHETETTGSMWRKVYKDLMNGVSYMLPFVVGGGILMAFSFLIVGILGEESELFIFFNIV